MLVPNTNTRARVLAMTKAPLRPGTRPVGAAQLARVEDTSTDGPEFAATPEGDGPQPQDRRGGVPASFLVVSVVRQGGPTSTSADVSVPRLAGFSLIT